jgi:hypothetical protein
VIAPSLQLFEPDTHIEKGTVFARIRYQCDRRRCRRNQVLSLGAHGDQCCRGFKHFLEPAPIGFGHSSETVCSHLGKTFENRLCADEYTNGLIRQYMPKRTSMAHLTQEDLDAIAAGLNSRSRKRLGYKTPEECYA